MVNLRQAGALQLRNPFLVEEDELLYNASDLARDITLQHNELHQAVENSKFRQLLTREMVINRPTRDLQKEQSALEGPSKDERMDFEAFGGVQSTPSRMAHIHCGIYMARWAWH